MNKAILIGNVGTDPELKKTTNGTDVVSLSLATNKKYTDVQGNKKEETQWHRLTFFAKLAETANNYVKKGNKIAIEGEIKNSTYTDAQGVQKNFSEIVVEKLELLGGGPASADYKPQAAQQQQAPKPEQQQQYAEKAAPAQAQAANQNFAYNPSDDVEDLPF